MPTHKQIEEAKAHLKEVDNAQDNIVEAMFDDLRDEYKDPCLGKETIDDKKL